MSASRTVRTGLCVAVGLLVVRLLGPAWPTGFPTPFPDSSSYVAVAAAGPFSPGFWFDERPPAYPLLIWIVGEHPRSIVVVQTLCHVLAWAWLLSTVRTRLHSRWIAAVTIAVLVLIAVQTRWLLWNTAVLTESLSATLGIACVAAWWRWIDDPGRFRTTVAVVLTVAWMLTRDSNATSLLVIVLPMLAAVAATVRRWPGPRRRPLAIALAALAAVGGYSLLAQAVSDRGETSFHNNVGLRWLPDEGMTRFMTARGMPMSDALAARAGGDAWADGEAFLRAPDLAEYRSWAGGRGRVAAVESFVWRAPWYLDRLVDELPAHTVTDHLAYDTFDVAANLPERPLGALDPAGSRAAMAAWGAVAIAGIAAAWRRRRATAVLLAVVAASVLSDLYLSFAGDAVEVGRHLAGPLFRWSVVTVLIAAVAADVLVAEARARRGAAPADEPAESEPVESVPVESEPAESVPAESVPVEHESRDDRGAEAPAWADRARRAVAGGVDAAVRRAAWTRRWYVPLTAGVLTVVAIVAVARMETRVADYDPQYMRVLVERAMRFGGSYYSNGIHNKGPLEPAVYELAARLGGHDGFWLVIAWFTMAAAVCVGLATGLATTLAGGPRVIGVGMAVLAVTHLTLSEADYAGVLYARNMTVALLSVAFVAAAYDPAWATRRRQVAASAVVALCVGLAVQTLLTACFTAAVVLAWAMWTRRDLRLWGRPVWVLLPAGAAAAFLAAPAYYAVFGPWRDFFDGWWVYARFMSEGTGRSLGSQLSLGWDQAFDYYRDRPALAVAIAAWAMVTAARWHRLDGEQRALRLLAVGWFAGAWVEMVLSQRYSSHYFSIIAVPTLLMLATLVGEAAGAARGFLDRRPALPLLPIAVVIATIYAGGTAPFRAGFEAAGDVTTVGDLAARRERGISGRTQVLRAALDLVSEDGDPLLMWTGYPWPYLDLHRVSATRYIWKTFLMGEIYLGRTGPEYVLAGTWDRFAADLDRTDPAAFLVESVTPLDPDTPFADRVASDFTTVFADDAGTLAYRNDLADWLLSPPPASRRARLPVPACTRLDGTLSLDAAATVGIEIDAAASPSAASPGFRITRSATAVEVESHHPSGAVFTTVTTLAEGDAALPVALPVTLVAGARAAVLVVDGAIAGAVQIDRDAAVRLDDPAGAVDVATLRASDPPAATGCAPTG